MTTKVTFWLIVSLFLAGIIGLCAVALSDMTSGVASSTAGASEPAVVAETYLQHAKPLPPEPVPMPPWLLLLVAAFALLQLLPVVIAWRKAQADVITQRQLREINFLCETPMFLGLLGSLLGVCLTQFTSGSLAAPLAYLTTIVGILLYLFGKLLIWVPLPYRPEYD